MTTTVLNPNHRQISGTDSSSSSDEGGSLTRAKIDNFGNGIHPLVKKPDSYLPPRASTASIKYDL